MPDSESVVQLDYLVIGHVTRDLVGDAFTIGGTASYSARTARALGCLVGAVTSASDDLGLGQALSGVLVARSPAATTTTFKNVYTPKGRRQMVLGVAETLVPEMVPAHWRAALVHVGPVARECAPALIDAFGDAFLGITPQGWMRHWDEAGYVSCCRWANAEPWLARADAVILSEEDVGGDEALLASYATQTKVLVVTDGVNGCTVYAHGRARHFPAPSVQEVDPTGAGDIFAAAFFVSLQRTGDLWAAARLANCVAARSVARPGLDSTPTPSEMAHCEQEVPLQAGSPL